MDKHDLPEGLLTRSRKTDFSTRANGKDMVIEGYFVVFNQPYFVCDWMEEVVSPQAFEGADTSDVRALIDHLPHLVLGRNTADTLSFRVDDKGLWASIKVNADDGDAMNLYARVQRGDVDQASFGFEEKTVAYTDLPDGRVRRDIQAIKKLWEVSVCTFPAYEQTSVGARARSEQEIKREIIRREKEKIRKEFKHHA